MIITNGKCNLPLYHGTDESVWNSSQEWRIHMKEICNCLLDELYTVYKENLFGEKVYDYFKNIPEYPRIRDAYIIAGSKIKGALSFQYDSIYLTFDFERAKRFANKAYVYGELGYATYWLYKGAITLK